MPINNILRSALKNGKSAVKNGVKNGAKNGVPKGVKLRPKLEAGDLARNNAVKQKLKQIKDYSQRLKDEPQAFNVDRVSDKYSQFLNKKPVKARNVIEDPVEAAKYKKAGQAYYAKHKSLGGYPFYKDKTTGEPTHYLKSNSEFNKDGSLRVKAVKLSERNARTARRQKWEKEQTLGPTGRGILVHHKSPLGLIDRIAAGLNPTEKRKFLKYVHTNNRWSTLKIGNEAENLIGLVGDKKFHPIHVDVHQFVDMAGLDDSTIDFTGATMEQRFGFIDEIAPLLDQIDEFIYGQIMAGKYPKLRHTSGPLKGQKKFKGYKRPPKSKKK